jgi:hypothetical protein
MTRHWTVSIDGGAPVHLDLAQYAAAIERAKQEGKPARVMIEANPTIEMTLPTGSKALRTRPDGKGGYFVTLPRRDPEAGDGAVRPAAGANPPDGTRIPPPSCSFGGSRH